MTRLLIAASGTGGHLFPALAVAEALPPDWSVQWLGVPDRLERELVPARYPLHTIRAGGLQGRGVRKLLQLIQLVAATGKVRRLIQREAIEVVFSTGGYIAGPTILAARWCDVPVVLHESNAIPGRVTRLLGRLCSRVAVGLPAAAVLLPRCRPLLCGTPVRRAFLEAAPLPDWVPRGEGPLLLVMGGSQGAVGLNRMVRPLVPRLLAAGCRVVHLTGSNDPEAGAVSSPGYVERPFSDELAGLLQHTDLAISRAGAGSLSELAVSGTPAVLVPFPQAADRHQDANAAAAAELGAAVVVTQQGPADPTLADTLWQLLGVRLGGGVAAVNPLLALQAGMGRLAVRDADQRLVQLLQQLA
ncbi:MULTISPECIES: UDP-N-acetylglucosamine--N-acetylmuramyl-(pentapeptide) pyrophosphoryl-undecaprenol N-acetylglucosamine transferase [unclassified Synechococcus]|uniref:UDP-N-acetylglucosamine--N-acetylmuramyl- (pentapeptide) pyrophosphoryl-undecaprenol N-acetylglucosamine transferase n=1 Tax=unclassified Synechococcus TaxID=2626047 RepID=UPI0021A5A746|nr:MULTISPECIES: UDP-N-acetylglucosamine--N-acetylmuramyl-(pentapeptide) pyrophosphoryl-undecaprenol N-acetylglucosamine transferase [unclassified Synechococcus]MCT0212681.1 UDP-N-acetylglucosamine--N-acetylmuramyl-(pentapeptide) pyrophosphoryl-undecaprenol N-acetylglucosamine transferase [Synechococcus sp. CS-1326]MCT0233689.1 UDP-N-acetylglucosamine--N-acetylmuramyl-(pentapeptide) pyrophosphoryl-undecaprenol N-acetylglucosamine transferase [Synechococcus sp. CS-1327]